MLKLTPSRLLHEPEQASQPPLQCSWVWPLPRLDGVAPCILTPFEDDSGTVDIGYPRRSFSRDFVPVFAACDGVIGYADPTGSNPTICLDHAGGWSTQYAELARLLPLPMDRFERRKVRVRAGDVLGHARTDRLQIRFALGRVTVDQWSFVDPSKTMHGWELLPWFDGLESGAGANCCARVPGTTTALRGQRHRPFPGRCDCPHARPARPRQRSGRR